MREPAGRFLAIDPGRVRMGLAFSDPTATIAQVLPPLHSSGRPKDLEALASLIKDKEIVALVVGCPRNLDGSRSAMTEFAEKLAEDLRLRTGLPVDLWDERLSSAEADRALISGDVRREDRRQMRDGVAAVLILQGFLDRRGLELPA